MNKKVFDYFVDLDRVELPREDGVLFCDNQQIRLCENIKNGVNKYYIDRPVCKKFYGKDLIRPVHIAGYVSSKMYNDLGILTPPQYIMKRPTQSTNPYVSSHATFLAQSVLTTGLVVKSALKVFDDIRFPKETHHPPTQIHNPPLAVLIKKWEILHNKNLQNFFLEFCTPECLDELIGLFLADEVRGDADRHGLNYFFYKHMGSDKFEGIIPIDLDNMGAVFYFNLAITKEDFNDIFITRKMSSYTPQQTSDPRTTHIDRIQNIINKLHSGNLSENNVQLLKSLLEYDFPELTKKALASHSLFDEFHTKTYEPIANLWEYNRETLGHELGL